MSRLHGSDDGAIIVSETAHNEMISHSDFEFERALYVRHFYTTDESEEGL